MKNHHLALVTVILLGTSHAWAEPTVSLYGRMNASFESQKSLGDRISVLQNNASRFGIRGTEDLGGGLSVGLALEHGFNIDTGGQTQSNFWGRQSELHFAGAFGMLRLGNYTSEAYYATADYVSMHNHDTGTSADALYAYVTRDINKIAYRTPDLNGLTVEVAMSLKENAEDHSYDLAANYAIGPLQLGAGYSRLGDQNQFAVRALYNLGNFTVGGYVQRDEDGLLNEDIAPLFPVGLGKRTNVRLAGMYTLNASEFHLNVGRAGNYSKVDNSTAVQYTLAYGYNLSKRTKLYAFYTDRNIDGSGVDIYGPDFSSFAVGLRHNF